MAVKWEATDQFGNLFVGLSSAQSVQELIPDIESLAAELSAAGKQGCITVDYGFGEINGPDPEAVSYVLQAPWLTDCDAEATHQSLVEALGNPHNGYPVVRA